MLKKIICSLFLASLSLIAFGQNDPNMRDKMEQRIDGRSNGDMRQDAGGDRAKNIDDTKRDGAVKGITKEGFAVCAGEFAICASSTCKPTGKTISVKEDGGKTTKQYPEAVCKCPVVTPSIASQNNAALVGLAALNEGNMNWSCRPPSKGTIWSYAAVDISLFPQESTSPPFKMAQSNLQTCPAGSGTEVNCWNFLCKIDKDPINGAKMATCFCPIGESPLGHPAPSSDGFLTAAGGYYDNPTKACSMYPVGMTEF